jgi:hypothetical protein
VAEVRGLTLFRDRFAAHKEKYILIGGCALHAVLTEADLSPRATKDLDIVLVVEALDASFVSLFWQFVEEGGYALRQVSQDTQRNFYRFQKPADPEFPAMLELFSREPALRTPIAPGAHLTPIPVGEDVESLSAILLDADYYAFILAARRDLMGMPYIGEGCLIALKALAWLEMRERRAMGAEIDSKHIRKHLMDVLSLAQVLTPESRFEASPRITRDIARFTDEARFEKPDISRFGSSVTLEGMLQRIRTAFVLP